MPLWKARKINLALAACAAVCVFLTLIFQQAISALLLLRLFFCIALISVNLTYWRCPSCRGHLGRDYGAYCQHCGEKLDMNQPIPSQK